MVKRMEYRLQYRRLPSPLEAKIFTNLVDGLSFDG